MSLKRPGRCAAVHDLQHRCLNLSKGLLSKSVSNRLHHSSANLHDLASPVSDNQIDVAVSNSKLFAQFVMKVRQWPEGLCCH